MKTLGKLFAMLLTGFSLQWLGADANKFVLRQNDGRMPVLSIGGQHVSFFDVMHVDLSSQSHYKLFCDIFPLPYWHDWQINLAVASIGDILIDAGELMLAFAPPLVLFVILYYLTKGLIFGGWRLYVRLRRR